MNLWTTSEIIMQQVATLLPAPRYTVACTIQNPAAAGLSMAVSFQVCDTDSEASVANNFTSFDTEQLENSGHAERWGAIIANSLREQLKAKRNSPRSDVDHLIEYLQSVRNTTCFPSNTEMLNELIKRINNPPRQDRRRTPAKV